MPSHRSFARSMGISLAAFAAAILAGEAAAQDLVSKTNVRRQA